jgi:hypothetical protein
MLSRISAYFLCLDTRNDVYLFLPHLSIAQEILVPEEV